ncbi:unnamed protein product [Strongylus vulgaris]|uniref:Ionotropic glutamate receptor L-glutamate and glycine-binding domain-containing protein n=1 Tax=Strongylus vulgaris TaxID=40348 RepID=A0A3P7JFF6_STRVU|nr:unnamed protein product [Strongylus vulgaris]
MLRISNLRKNPKGGYYWDKVVTLHEPPFIIVSDVDPDTGRCPGNQGSICDWGDEEIDTDGGNKNTKKYLRNRTLWKCCSGYCVDLLNKLANDIGFTYTLYKVRDEKWGLKTVRLFPSRTS